jgi:phospholipid transport system substrate-binding protein
MKTDGIIREMKKKTLIAFCVTMVLALPVIGRTAHTPIDAVRATVEAVLHTMRDKSLAAPEMRQKRREKIKALISERFDFTEMAKRSLARHWKKRTPEERKEFVRIFSELLQSSYIDKIEAYTNEKVTYDSEKIRKKGKYGIVHTTVVTKDVNIPIDYKLIYKNGKWLVYDVVIEGVSFISTYRSQYNKVIVRESYTKLVEKMKQKLEQAEAM